MKGKSFGRLTVVKRSRSDNNRRTYWLCRCVCGNEKEIRSDNLTSGRVESCGCLHKEVVKQKGKVNIVHGQYGTRIYNIYHNMMKRCYYPKATRYEDWGGRGIRVCNEWKESFNAFYSWAINNGYSDKLTLDRIDNDGNYEPSNCRWATYKEQNDNKRVKSIR